MQSKQKKTPCSVFFFVPPYIVRPSDTTKVLLYKTFTVEKRWLF